MPGTVFISDLHLDASRPAVTAALADFLQANTHRDALYILGDLFEAWIGDDDDAPLAAEIGAMLARYSRSGPALYLMRGNRDFLLGQAFCERCSATSEIEENKSKEGGDERGRKEGRSRKEGRKEGRKKEGRKKERKKERRKEGKKEKKKGKKKGRKEGGRRRG